MLQARVAVLSIVSVWAVASVGQSVSDCSMQKAIESHLQGLGMTVKSVTPAKGYQVNYACDSVADCAESKLPIGTSFRVYLTFQYSGVVATLPEFYSSLLIYDSQRQVIIGDALSSWMESVRARAISQGGWGKFQAKFKDLFLTKELPEGSQLIMLSEHRDRDFNYSITYHSRPIASAVSNLGLSEPITANVLEMLPPRIKWTLKLKKPIAGDIFVRWYVKDLASGDIVDADSFTTPSNRPQQSTLQITSSADDKWASNSCRMFNVYIDRNPVGENREVFRPPTVVASKFGGKC